MTVAFITLSASLIGTAVSVLRHTRTVAGRLGLVLIGVGALGLLIAAAFTTDPITTPADAHSRSGQLHILGASLDFSPIGMLLVSWSLSRTRRWRSVRPKLMITAGLAAALMVAFAAALPHDGQFGPGVWAGFIGRLLLLSYLGWVATVGWAVLRPTRRSTREAAPGTSQPGSATEPSHLVNSIAKQNHT